MNLDKETSFARIIEEHLELKRRNSRLDPNMQIDRYREDPFENHPHLKAEERPRLGDTLSGRELDFDLELSKVLAPPGEESEPEAPADPDDTLWGECRDFDWGD